MDIDYDALLAPKRISAVLAIIFLGISAGLVLTISAHAAGDATLDYTEAQKQVAETCQAYDGYGDPITDRDGRPVTNKTSATCSDAGYVYLETREPSEDDTRRGSFTN